MNRRRIDKSERVQEGRSAVRRVGRAFARVLGALAGTALLGWGCVESWAWAHTSDTFELRRIEVTGLKRAQRGELLARAGLAPGANVFSIDVAAASLAIEQDPWVQRATVERSYPDGLVVDVLEHEPIALVSLGGLYAVGADGTLFKRLQPTDRLDLPVITGLSRAAFSGERRDDDPGLRLALTAIDLFAAHRLDERAPLSELHVSTEAGSPSLVAFLGDEPIEVNLGPSEDQELLSRRLDYLALALDELDRRGRRAEFVDVGNVRKPQWVAVRLAGE